MPIPDLDRVRKALDEYAAGGGANEISHKHGFKGSPDMFSAFLEKFPEDYRRIQVGFALQQKEDCEQALCSAKDNAVVRSCEVLIKNAQWTLERLASSTYATKRQEAPMPTVNIYIANLHGDPAKAISINPESANIEPRLLKNAPIKPAADSSVRVRRKRSK